MKRVFLDTETTGFSPGQIAQISMIIDEDGKEVVAKNYFFTIDYITSGAEEVCGRGIEFYSEASKGRRFKDDMNEIFEILKDATLIAHNIKFDENFISTEFWRQNILFKPAGRFDTMEFFKNICKIPDKYGKIKYPKLEELVNFYDINKDKVAKYSAELFGDKDYTIGFHDARYDTTAMFVVFQIYKEQLSGANSWKIAFS